MEIGSVVSQALPAEEEEEEEELGREERSAEGEGEEKARGSPRVCGEVRRDGV